MIIIFILLNLLFFGISILPIWDLTRSSKNLLSGTDTYIYTISVRDMYKLHSVLKKTIRKLSNGTITHSNTLKLNTSNDEKVVDFEVIESFYQLDDNRKILCPIGKFEPINLDNWIKYQNDKLNKTKNWDLKCYNHNSGFFFIFYMSHGEDQIYDLVMQNGQISYKSYASLQFYQDLYDFKLVNKNNNYEQTYYNICALVKKDNYIQFIGSKFKLNDKNNVEKSTDLNKTLIEAKANSLGYFRNGSNDFYYITYNDVNDFSSGFSTSTVSGEEYYTDNVQVSNNYTSPFSFIDEVEIKEMNFLLYTNYVYYSIYNKVTGKTYHGVLDVKLNKVIFNTDEDIDVFIPYSLYSMLAITKETAYEICFIKDSNTGNCLDTCSNGYINVGVNGNICGGSCSSYLLIPEGVCVSECNSTLYVIKDNYCGLCKDLENSRKFKFTKGSQCLSEKPSNSHFYIEKYSLLECDSGYKLNNTENECIPHCYESCETCSEYSEDINNQKCLTCKEGYYLQSTSPSNCLFDCTGDSREKCLTCNEESNELGLCLSCKTGYIRVNYTTLPEKLKYYDCLKPDDPILKKNFYYDEDIEEYKPCYKTCKTCSEEGDEKEHYCLTCESGYMFRPGSNPTNNCVVYSEYYYISPYDQYKPLEVFQCPEEAKYMIKETKSCIYNCQQDDKHKYLYNGNCVDQCPSGTHNDNFICKVDSNKCTFGENDLNLVNNNLDVIETLVKTYLSEFNYTKKHISQYNNKNYTIIIYINANCIKELSLEMPYIDFLSCYKKVQEAYNITDDLIISIADKKSNLNPRTYYSFYHPASGLKLDADSICKNITIVVKENAMEFLDETSTYYDTQVSLTEQGINIFDLKDPFFTDICFDFDNPLKKDIPLGDRIEYFYPNVSLCDKGCEYKGINLEDMTASCDCTFNDISNNEILQDAAFLGDTLGNILDLINSSNILVFKCIKFMFNHFTSSIGGWISVILSLIQIVTILLYFFMELPKIQIYIFSITKRYLSFLTISKKPNKDAPPKKQVIIDKKGKNKESKKIVQNNIFIYNPKDISNNKVDEMKFIKNKSKVDLKSSENKKIMSFSNNKELNLISSPNEKDLASQKSFTVKKEKEFFKEYFSTSPDDMEFDDAFIYDKRTFCVHFAECLKEKQIIAHTFIAHDDLKPRTMKIIVFILNVCFYFIINGLLFSESVISELFKVNEEDENFFSYVPRSIGRIIYSTFISIAIGIITDFFFVGEQKLKGILKREKSDKNILKIKTMEFFKEIQKRNIAFIIISSIILLFSFFYLLCFNYVYPYTQIEWIKSSITIVIIMQILSTLKCFAESGLRFLSFKCNSEKIYKISKMLD